MNKTKRILIFLLGTLQIVPLPCFANSARIRTVAVVAAPGSNPASKEMALALQVNLKGNNSYRVIGYEATNQLLQSYSSIKPEAKGLSSVVSMISSGRKEYTVNANVLSALKLLDQSIALINKLAPSLDTSELLTKAELTKAWILFQEGQGDRSYALIKNSYGLSQRDSTSLQGFSTEFRNFVKNSSPAAGSSKGQVTFLSDPAAVDLFINGHFVGSTPKTLSLDSGNYSVGFSANGRENVNRKLRVDAGKSITSRASLAWQNKAVDKSVVAGSWNGLSSSEKLSIAAKIGQATQADKVVVVNVNQSGSSYLPAVQVFDNNVHQALMPISYGKTVSNLKGSSQDVLNYFSNRLSDQLSKDALDLYQGDFDKNLVVDQRVATRPKQPITKKPVFWAVVGTVVIGGIVAGVLASGGGSKSSAGTGTVEVPLGGF